MAFVAFVALETLMALAAVVAFVALETLMALAAVVALADACFFENFSKTKNGTAWFFV